MKRSLLTISAVLLLVIAASGCSFREVQLWFQVVKHTSITTDQAKSIGDVVNSKRAAGCDTRYVGLNGVGTPCVPNNATSVHCIGTTGEGPAVRGPLAVSGWDAFGLDPDGDKYACVDPVSSLDTFGQVVGGIEVAGWTFDPNVTVPINVDVYENGVGSRFLADAPRADVAAAYPGAGTDHGFDLTSDADPESTHQMCVYAINVGAGGNQQLACKTITIKGEGTAMYGTDYFRGLIEGADRVPGGIHIRGFIFDDSNEAVPANASFDPSNVPTTPAVTHPADLVRDDVATAYAKPAGNRYGFDFVQPTAGNGFADATQVCLFAGPASSSLVMCRNLDS